MNTFRSVMSFALILTSASARAATVQAQLPCADAAGDPTLRTCSEVLNGSAQTPGILDQIKKRVQAQIEAYYGTYPDSPGGAPGKHPSGVDYDPVSPPGRAYGPTVCSLLEGPFIPASETDNDHNGKSCGQSMELQIHIDVSTALGCATGEPSFEPTFLKLFPQGTLEDGYLRGAIVPALTCYYSQVTGEIAKSKGLAVKDIGGAPSPCSSAAADLLRLTKNNQDAVTEAKQGKGENGGLTQANLDYFKSANEALIGTFTQIAVCEIMARAQNAYVNRVGTPTAQQSVLDSVRKSISAPCIQETKDRYYHSGDVCHKVPSDDEIGHSITDCYRKRLPGVMRDYIRNIWPADGGTCGE